MKLNLSVLTQPTSKERGQVGTTGTPPSMRVAPSPAAGDTLGTRLQMPGSGYECGAMAPLLRPENR